MLAAKEFSEFLTDDLAEGGAGRGIEVMLGGGGAFVLLILET